VPDQGETRKRSETAEDFPDVLRRSIQEGITRTVGRETAMAVEFYVDSSLAVKDIAAYTVALQRMFRAGSKILEERCARTLYANLGLEFKVVAGYELDDYVEAARATVRKERK
jgi:limonene-1,2-epoxide hydrolase